MDEASDLISEDGETAPPIHAEEEENNDQQFANEEEEVLGGGVYDEEEPEGEDLMGENMEE